MKLTNNFNLKEFFVSADHPNIAANLYRQMTKGGNHSQKSEKIIDSLFMLSHLILQPVRDEFGIPLTVISGYRSKDLNRRAEGSENSRHLLGKAADVTTDNPWMLLRVFEWIKKCREGAYGELILYRHKDKGSTPNFLHVSTPRRGTEVNVKHVMR